MGTLYMYLAVLLIACILLLGNSSVTFLKPASVHSVVDILDTAASAGKGCHSAKGSAQIHRTRIVSEANRHGCACASLRIDEYALRPKLMIVVPETKDRIGRHESLHVADNLSKYCKRHGYLFKLHHYEVDPSLGVYGTRWRELLQYWEMADWLLMLDADTVVANMSNSMDMFLDGPQHVMLALRANREITAAAVALRSTEYGRCFVTRWIKLIAAQRLLGREKNADNGALLLAVAELLDANLAEECNKLQIAPRQYHVYLDCWEAIYPKLASLVNSTSHPVRVYTPLGGFWREHNRGDDGNETDTRCRPISVLRRVFYTRCWSNDIFVSGWKKMGMNMWPELGSNRTLANCSFNGRHEEIRLARQCCYVAYPGCFANNGTNVCRQLPACHNPQVGQHMQVRAHLGFGICNMGRGDTTHMTSPLYQECDA